MFITADMLTIFAVQPCINKFAFLEVDLCVRRIINSILQGRDHICSGFVYELLKATPDNSNPKGCCLNDRIGDHIFRVIVGKRCKKKSPP